jgi:hypothetical protein
MKSKPIPFHVVLEALKRHREQRLHLKRILDEIGKELKSILRETDRIEKGR